MRYAGFALLVALLACVLMPSSAGATAECKGLTGCASSTGEWIDVQPHAVNQYSALGCPDSSQIAVGLDWDGPAVDKVYVNMAGDQGRGPWQGMFLHLSNRTATAHAVRVVIGCIPRAATATTAADPGAPVQTKTTALHAGTSTHTERCASGQVLEGGGTAEFTHDQPPTQKQLDAVTVTNHLQGDALVTTTEVGAAAHADPVELQQDIVCG